MSEHGLAAGTLLADRYEVGALLGSGGFGATYRAWDRARFGAACVVKELLPGRQANDVARRLFEREARVLSELAHPQIPKLEAYFEHDGRFILIQEYVDGETLAARLQRDTRLDEAEVRQMVLQLLDVLGYLHGRTPPVIHRDIKPANIILARDGRVVLIDFGAVREAIGRDATGTAVGTAGYTPLEQYAGRATPASDCYALGATALHLVSGTHPMDWHDRTSGALTFAGRIPCSPSFESFLLSMMAEPSRRVADARAARELLLGTATQLGGDANDAKPAPPAANDGGSVRPAPASSPRAATAAATVGGDGARVVPPAPSRALWRVAVPGLAIVAAATLWIALGGGGTGGAPVPVVSSETPDSGTGTPAARGGPTAADGATNVVPALPAGSTSCQQPTTIVHRTESQFDLHLLCPSGWGASYLAPVRASRIAAPDAQAEVWAGLWRPASSNESPEAFGERWRVAMAPYLGAITMEVDARPDASLVRWAVSAAAGGRVRTGSLQVERASAGADAHMTWSLLLGATDATQPMALQVLGSVDYRDPAAPPAPAAGGAR